MLSIGKMLTGSEEYYLGVVASGREDFYVGGGEALGVWLGQGSASLRLSGQVSGRHGALTCRHRIVATCSLS